MTYASMRRRSGRWLDVGSFALGVLAEALAQLRAEKKRRALRSTRGGLAGDAPATLAAAPVRIDPARPRTRSRPAGSPRPRRRPTRRKSDPSSTP